MNVHRILRDYHFIIDDDGEAELMEIYLRRKEDNQETPLIFLSSSDYYLLKDALAAVFRQMGASVEVQEADY